MIHGNLLRFYTGMDRPVAIGASDLRQSTATSNLLPTELQIFKISPSPLHIVTRA